MQAEAPAAPTFAPRGLLGLAGNLRSNVVYLDSSSVLYIAGNYLCRLNVETEAQEVSSLAGMESVPSEVHLAGPTALAVSPSRMYCAVALRYSSPSGFSTSLSIFSTRTLKRRKQIPVRLGEPGSPEQALGQEGAITALAFSCDDSWVGAIGSAPTWGLGVYSVDKGTLAATLDLSEDAPRAGAAPLAVGGASGAKRPFAATGLSFSPTDPQRFLVFGSCGYARFMRIEEDTAMMAACLAVQAAALRLHGLGPDGNDLPPPPPPPLNPGEPEGEIPPPPRPRTKKEKEAGAAAAAAALASVASTRLSHVVSPLPVSPTWAAFTGTLRGLVAAQGGKGGGGGGGVGVGAGGGLGGAGVKPRVTSGARAGVLNTLAAAAAAASAAAGEGVVAAVEEMVAEEAPAEEEDALPPPGLFTSEGPEGDDGGLLPPMGDESLPSSSSSSIVLPPPEAAGAGAMQGTAGGGLFLQSPLFTLAPPWASRRSSSSTGSTLWAALAVGEMPCSPPLPVQCLAPPWPP